ncbi:MAG: DUF58 domain-containing protein [Candidatus Nitricoxidivorans perseverans]|uniref:DUF58 domain-containing protein n=1 Tax=Candidatus Nitricoxidivorans perseverans TaxID=2975601 RepID=A0AA49IZG1_9PROT|nr:MAG: DUF58 domain-containing protein [Candidatus Nitricoxidivorans perseverans]
MSLRSALHERFVVWALRTRPPEESPVILGQRRVYVLPTRAGLAYAASLLVMLVGAINYNLSLGYALVFLLAGLGLSAILHTFRNLVGLVVAPGRAEPVFAGDAAIFHLTVRNGRDDARRVIRLGLTGQPADTIDVPGGSAASARLSLPAPRRGWLAMPRVTIETRYPLGLVRAWSYCAPDFHCLVYPHPAPDAPPLPFSRGGAGGRIGGGQGTDDFSGLRGHQPADPPRHVAWKIAARQDEAAPLLTKQFAGTSSETLWLEWDSLPPGMDVESRLSLLARWALDAHGAGLAWGLRLPSATLAPTAGAEHLHACLKALALHGQA